jgi:uncharacterized membrane protein
VTKPSRGEVAARYAKSHDVSLSEAAKLHGVSRERVRQKWHDLFGDEPSPLQKARERRDSAIADLASQGLSVTEIAEVVGSAMDTVNRVRNRNSLMIVNGNDKRAVTEETKTRILELARAGKSGAVIAHETGAVVRQGPQRSDRPHRENVIRRVAEHSRQCAFRPCVVTAARARQRGDIVAPPLPSIYRADVDTGGIGEVTAGPTTRSRSAITHAHHQRR